MPTETIFNPKDNTTKEKFKSFEYVNKCYQRDKENINKTDDFLGESSEIKQAYNISRNSLKQAHQSLSQEELKQAFDNGDINKEQVKNFQKSKRMIQMEDKREANVEKQHQAKLKT